jgi:hypothetical protein
MIILFRNIFPSSSARSILKRLFSERRDYPTKGSNAKTMRSIREDEDCFKLIGSTVSTDGRFEPYRPSTIDGGKSRPRLGTFRDEARRIAGGKWEAPASSEYYLDQGNF